MVYRFRLVGKNQKDNENHLSTKTCFMKLLLLYIGLFLSLSSIGQVEWLKTEGTQNDDGCKAITTDAEGNLITVGTQGTNTMFLFKTDAQGNTIWSKYFNQIGDITPNAVKVVNNFIYVSGDFVANCIFDTITIQSTSSTDVFLIKFNSDGSALDALTFGGYDLDQCTAMNVDYANNIYVAGTCRASVDLDPTSAVDMSGTSGMFIIKLNENEDYQWSKVFISSAISSINDFCFDSNNNIILVGRYTDSVDFDPGMNQNQMTASGNDDGFVVKLDNDGNFIWSKSIGAIPNIIGTTSTDFGTAVACDSENNIVWGGVYSGELQIPELGITEPGYGYLDFFIQKLSESGALIWTETFGNEYIDFLKDIIIDDTDNIHFCGSFEDSIDFDPGPNEFILSSPNDRNAFIVAFTSTGNLHHAVSFSGVCSSEVSSMSISSLDEIFFSGNFSGSLVVNCPPVVNTFYSTFYNDCLYGKLGGSLGIVDSESESLEYSIFPNPSNGQYNVKKTVEIGTHDYCIVDSKGQTMMKGVINSIEFIDISKYADGLYYFKTAFDCLKLIKQ